MYKLILPAAAILAFTFLGANGDTAQAKHRGFHFSSGGVHVDIGNPHRTYYGGGWGGYGHSAYYPSHSYCWHQPAHTWHDTSHWDYHGPSLQWHGNHYDYVPGHYDWHQDGHWDHNHP